MGLELPSDDPWVARGYGQARIEPGERPAVLVVDLQYAFTDPAFEFGGSELIERATANTARVLDAARGSGVPVFQTVVAWRDEKDVGLWTIKLPPCAKITPGSTELTRQADNELSLNLMFVDPGDLTLKTFVYQTPADIVALPIEFEFTDLPLP